ncbi:hypothetical protein CR513_32157, partial [Mucuna pruriens]
MLVHDLDTIDNNVQNGEQHNYGDQQLEDGFDVPHDNDVEEEQEMSQDENLDYAPEPPLIQLKRSNRQTQSSTSYTSDEYVTLIDREEPNIHDALDAKLLKLAKVHIDDNGTNMMTKRVLRGRFEACCEIIGLAITST